MVLQPKAPRHPAAFMVGAALLGAVVGFDSAGAQTSPILRGSGGVATPVEVAINVVNGVVECRPPRLRLPKRDVVELRVINRAAQPVMFVAPEFFKSSKHQGSAGFVYDVAAGGFLAAPNSTIRVQLKTPRFGEYYYSCYLPGRVPNPASSGFLIVTPAT